MQFKITTQENYPITVKGWYLADFIHTSVLKRTPIIINNNKVCTFKIHTLTIYMLFLYYLIF